MRDIVLALAVPLLICASGIYAACDTWWRRRHPAPDPHSHAGRHLAAERTVADAEAIVADRYAILAEAERSAARLGGQQ
ncbi:hypothetical protein [Streptomyces sp. AcE210]|uniref:hypothetical protein n=1 Tax=Streptomyces sp. AcE210 TaxID=2292703 RepID=UPI000E30401E|nr:hypothetical protein [Streptomyces sp. AcE210]RFC75819.1 hypothetical protein DXZ75_15260 [Streptomyces sp. AcE210]